MTEEDNAAFDHASKYDICDEMVGNNKVHDDFHISGKYRGAAYEACNLKLRIYPNRIKVPVVFHNLRGYDGHLIMAEMGKTKSNERNKISCIPNNMEKHMTFRIGQLQMMDSLQFLNFSLDSLTRCLKKE